MKEKEAFVPNHQPQPTPIDNNSYRESTCDFEESVALLLDGAREGAVGRYIGELVQQVVTRDTNIVEPLNRICHVLKITKYISITNQFSIVDTVERHLVTYQHGYGVVTVMVVNKPMSSTRTPLQIDQSSFRIRTMKACTPYCFSLILNSKYYLRLTAKVWWKKESYMSCAKTTHHLAWIAVIIVTVLKKVYGNDGLGRECNLSW